MKKESTRLKRPRHPMPEYIRRALEEEGLLSDYEDRPAYQQNDYIAWIDRAKREETREKRIRQMLNELKRGGVYMNMAHPASAKGNDP